MASTRSPLQWLVSLLLLAGVASALKFELFAHSGAESAKSQRCVRNYVGKDTLVVATIITDGRKGDGQQLNVHVRDAPYGAGGEFLELTVWVD